MIDLLEFIDIQNTPDDITDYKYIMCTEKENRWCTLICKYEDLIPLKNELKEINYDDSNDYMVGDKFRPGRTDLWTWIYYIGDVWSYNKSNKYMYIRIINNKGLYVRKWPIALPGYDTIEHALTKAKNIIPQNDISFKNFINYAKQNKIKFLI